MGVFSKTILFMIALVFFLPSGITVSATTFAPYYTYGYNSRFRPTPVPAGYVPGRVFNAQALGLETDFENLQDIFYTGDEIFILDGGGKIVVTDANFNLQRVYKYLIYFDGSHISFTGAQGIFVDMYGQVYIADTESRRILIAKDGYITRIISRPYHALPNTNAPFDVNAIIVDSDGIIYAVANSINLGIFRFNNSGEFLHFWGPNEVPIWGQAVVNYIRRRFLTEAQIQFMQQVTPVTIRNFTIDANGFIYTVSPFRTPDTILGNVRKLNFLGENILDESILFGDSLMDNFSPDLRSDFIDVAIDSDGFINLLDRNMGRIFQFTNDGYLVTVFGSLGDQRGTFDTPSAIVAIGSRIYVTDSRKNLIYEFVPTEFAMLYREALLLLQQFELDKSRELWNQVLVRNSNSRVAHFALGTIADTQGYYSLAMEHFRIIGELHSYSLAFSVYRQEMMAEHWPFVMLGAILLIALLFVLSYVWGKLSAVKQGSPYCKMESKYLFPLYILTHPTDGFSQFKHRHHESLIWVAGILTAWFFGRVFQFLFLGTAFNINHAIDFNLINHILQSFGVFFMFVIANWCVCSFLDGKGTFKEIVTTTAYALLPFVISLFVNLFISQFLTMDEAMYMTMVSTIGIAWSAILLFCGMYSIHDYSFGKTLLSLLLTVLGMLIMVFIAILFFGLIQQVWSFGVSVYREGLTRFR